MSLKDFIASPIRARIGELRSTGVRAPGPRTYAPAGVADELRADQPGFLVRMQREHGDVARFRVLWLTMHLVSHPDGVRHVLQENHKGYDKRTRGFEKLKLLLGNGLLTSDGDFWLRQRRIMQPAFHRERISGFGAAMARHTEAMCDAWRPRVERGETIDVAREMMRVTLGIVAETLLGADVSRDAEAVAESMDVLLHEANRRILSAVDLTDFVKTPPNAPGNAPLRRLDEIVWRTIESRRSAKDRPADLLTMLMDARDAETGEGMTDQQLRDEVMTIFLAGHETTANALTWTWYLLSLHPDVRRRLERELSDALGTRAPNVDDLVRLPYTKMVLQESMRLYPPAWLTARRPVREDVIGGYTIPPDGLVFVSPWVTHRHPAFWDNPEGFDPERFSPDRAAKMHRFQYFPFGGGPRICIGQGFAMIEAHLLLARIAQRYRLDLVPGTVVEPEPLITLRPKRGLPMRATLR